MQTEKSFQTKNLILGHYNGFFILFFEIFTLKNRQDDLINIYYQFLY